MADVGVGMFQFCTLDRVSFGGGGGVFGRDWERVGGSGREWEGVGGSGREWEKICSREASDTTAPRRLLWCRTHIRPTQVQSTIHVLAVHMRTVRC